MRILSIHLKNLNSLVGEWKIDFEHPSYRANGLFAITGPTGAGKTTLLDAICLALYGKTPRLSRVNKSGNEAMSRQTGECFAELRFETQAGRYRCTWSQRRARKKADGELQAPRHELVNDANGEILAEKLQEIQGEVERVTGMDFDRFTRTMLLAQGSFDAFLRATSSERAPILEQITGTEIYSEISLYVHERKSKEEQALRQLEKEAESFPVYSAEEEHALREDCGSKEKQAQLLAESLKRCQDTLNTVEELEKRQRTLVLDLTAKEKKQSDGQKRLKDLSEEKLKLEACIANKRKALGAVRQLLESTQADASLIEMLGALQQRRDALAKDAKQLEKEQTASEKCRQELSAVATKLTTHEGLEVEYQERRSIAVAVLNAHILELEALCAKLRRDEDEVNAQVNIHNYREARLSLEPGAPCPLCGSTEHPFVDGALEISDSIKQRLQSIKTAINKATEERDAIRLTLAKHGEDVKAFERSASETPQKWMQELASATLSLRTNREQGQGAKTQKALKESLLENLHSNIEGLRGRIEESQKELHGLLERYGVAHDSDFKDLSTRRDAYKNRTTEEASLEKELATLCPQLDATMTLIQKETETLADHTADIKARKQEIEQLTAQRCEIVPSSDALRQTLVEGQKEQTVLQQSIGALREKVQRNEEMKDKRASHAQAIEAQQQELLRWRDLHLLIGSADGKKFRDFAQGLTFEMLIHRANSQLQKMSDRYLLVRDRMHSLELNVIDNYQGGEERSTKNLSGGESFIVSLALALGLSQMSSQKVRVESLFLDEGFGTLDEEALDTALETLSGLQEEGKSIGVISHVAALKERISTQIRILADAAGRSQICGPGCARLD